MTERLTHFANIFVTRVTHFDCTPEERLFDKYPKRGIENNSKMGFEGSLFTLVLWTIIDGPKVMVTVFWDAKGVILVDYLEKGEKKQRPVLPVRYIVGKAE